MLVTGSRGFIGINLVNKLRVNPNIDIIEFTRDNSLNDLENFIEKADFIFHFAGEVRPASSDDAFLESNVILTKHLCFLLEKHGKRTPILYASSIHAKLAKNQYGKTKKQSEELIEVYSINSLVDCYIFRLPHLFGPVAKPNHNSAITTWIYNSIHDIEIIVYDRNIKIEYVYVLDVISEFMDCLALPKNEGGYLYPHKAYSTTLGQVVDYLDEFKNNIDNEHYIVSGNTFKEKLFVTYKSYLSSLG